MTSPTTAPAAGTFHAGDIITARPWISGAEALIPREGIVTAGTSDDTAGDGCLMVWFRDLGDLSDDQAGRAFQPILAVKAARSGHISDLPRKEQERICRLLGQRGLTYTAPLYRLLVSALSPKG
jgi:hypothetical protein